MEKQEFVREDSKEIVSKAGEVVESGILEAKGWEYFKEPELMCQIQHKDQIT